MIRNVCQERCTQIKNNEKFGGFVFCFFFFRIVFGSDLSEQCRLDAFSFPVELPCSREH